MVACPLLSEKRADVKLLHTTRRKVRVFTPLTPGGAFWHGGARAAWLRGCRSASGLDARGVQAVLSGASDAAFVKAFAADRELRTAVRRFGLLRLGLPEARAEPVGASGGTADAAAVAAARSTAEGPPSARHDGSARPEGARAADHPPHADAAAVPAERVRVVRGAGRPRRRSAAAVARRQDDFEQKWRRRKLFEVLQVVGHWGRGEMPSSPDTAEPIVEPLVGAVGGAPGEAVGASATSLSGASAKNRGVVKSTF